MDSPPRQGTRVAVAEGSAIAARTQCRSCSSVDLASVFDLGPQPFANSLLRAPDAEEGRYPLELGYCNNCGLLQLLHTADPKALFSHYVWVTGTSVAARAHADRFCTDAVGRLPVGGVARYVLEVGSNDGTFLRPFIDRGIAVLGIDPAENIVAKANTRGIPSRCGFFGEAEAKAITAERGRPSLVIARNVLPHVADPLDFARGLAHLIGGDDLAAIEFHDGWDILRGLQYDSIYHEHLCYFTATTIGRLLASVGLDVIDLATSPMNGGSLIAYVRTMGAASTSTVAARLAAERLAQINTLDSWREFGRRAVRHAARLKELTEAECSRGRMVVGYGASARSSTLLNFAGIDHRHLASIADQNPLKHRLYTAGTHIPVLPPEEVFRNHPDVVLLLAWNFRSEVEALLRGALGFEGRMIVPLPGDPVVDAAA